MSLTRYTPSHPEDTRCAAMEPDPAGEWVGVGDVRELLDLALELVGGLSAQQAMGDDWYEPGHDRLMAARDRLGTG